LRHRQKPAFSNIPSFAESFILVRFYTIEVSGEVVHSTLAKPKQRAIAYQIYPHVTEMRTDLARYRYGCIATVRQWKVRAVLIYQGVRITWLQTVIFVHTPDISPRRLNIFTTRAPRAPTV
jgi:hypothetical protein